MRAKESGEVGEECVGDFEFAGLRFVEQQQGGFAGRLGMQGEIVHALAFKALVLLVCSNQFCEIE